MLEFSQLHSEFRIVGQGASFFDFDGLRSISNQDGVSSLVHGLLVLSVDERIDLHSRVRVVVQGHEAPGLLALREFATQSLAWTLAGLKYFWIGLVREGDALAFIEVSGGIQVGAAQET